MKKYILPIAVTAALAACSEKTTSTSSPESSSSTSSHTSNTSKLTTIDVAYMDPQIGPQKDFFRYCNENWILKNPVPPSESRWGSFNELDQRNKGILTEILKTDAATPGEKGSQAQILGDFFESYVNMAQRDKAVMGSVKDRIYRIKNLKAREDISKVVAEQHAVGINSLFNFGVEQDLKNVNMHMAGISQGGLGLPNRDFYFSPNKEEIRTKYRIYIQNAFILAGNPEEEAKRIAGIVYEFEKRLADSMMAPAEMREPEKTYNKYSFADAKKLFPSFQFETYLKTLGSESFDTIIVGQPAFLRQINELMGEYPMENWKYYLEWKTINHYASSMDSRWEALNFEFYGKTLSGKKEMKPSNERAIDRITGSPIGELLGKAFVEKAYSKEAQKRVNEMVDNLLASFRDRIEGLEWMSADTKKEALKKLNSIGRKLGFPDQWKDFSRLNISRTDYISNVDELARYAVNENLEKLHKPVDRKEWEMPAHMVNAYYHPLLNEIAFPAGIMQPPFFDVNAEDAVNYGRIGMVIGHEFTHGFDDMGSKFGADGSFTNWWTEKDRERFEERTTILGQTFAAFCPTDNQCVNPELTMGENIADLGGLTLAFHAYTRTAEYKSGEIREGFTPAQRFFIAYAQLWKINYTPAELQNRLATDPHSPGMFRVNGPLKNCPEFFEAFDVKPGDSMRNPDTKVAKIW